MNNLRRTYIVNSVNTKYKPEEIEFFSGLSQKYGFSDFLKKIREVFSVDEKESKENLCKIYPEQNLVLIGYTGIAGTLWLWENCKKRLETTLPEEFIESAANLKEYLQTILTLEITRKWGITAMVPVAEGGIFTALWEMASIAKVGMEVNWEEILIKQITIEFCEALDLNPYKLYSGSCLLVSTNQGYSLIQELSKLNIPSKIIGQITKKTEKVIHHGEICRAITRPEPDELLKIALQSKGEKS